MAPVDPHATVFLKASTATLCGKLFKYALVLQHDLEYYITSMVLELLDLDMPSDIWYEKND